jgi:hypothetical protein
MVHVKRTILLSIFISLSFITVLAQQPPPLPPAPGPESGTWINVAPADAGFSVLMPGKPSEKVEAVEAHPGIENHTMMLETKLGGYAVSYTQFPEDVTDTSVIKEMLDRGREGGIASSSGKLKSEKDIKLNEYLGREWVLELPGGLLATARAYWVKRRLYQAVFVAAPNASDPPELTKLRQEMSAKFLDSFSLTGDAK